VKFIKEKDRNQTEIICFNQIIDEANEVRLIDLFVSSLSLSEFGFKTKFIENGRSSSDLLRLFIYGYLIIIIWNYTVKPCSESH
jgi:hypothetical protein